MTLTVTRAAVELALCRVFHTIVEALTAIRLQRKQGEAYMPVLGDWVPIQSTTVTIGAGQQWVSAAFSTAGRSSTNPAMVMLQVKDLETETPVYVNGNFVGNLTATPSGSLWSTQMLPFNGNWLLDGNNLFSITGLDTFSLKAAVCLFHQSA